MELMDAPGPEENSQEVCQCLAPDRGGESGWLTIASTSGLLPARMAILPPRQKLCGTVSQGSHKPARRASHPTAPSFFSLFSSRRPFRNCGTPSADPCSQISRKWWLDAPLCTAARPRPRPRPQSPCRAGRRPRRPESRAGARALSPAGSCGRLLRAEPFLDDGISGSHRPELQGMVGAPQR